MAARSSGPRFFASNGTMHQATRLEGAKRPWLKVVALVKPAPRVGNQRNWHWYASKTKRKAQSRVRLRNPQLKSCMRLGYFKVFLRLFQLALLRTPDEMSALR